MSPSYAVPVSIKFVDDGDVASGHENVMQLTLWSPLDERLQADPASVTSIAIDFLERAVEVLRRPDGALTGQAGRAATPEAPEPSEGI